MSGSISISEDDFQTLCDAANEAMARGDMEAAVALDKIARKANVALTLASTRHIREAVGNADRKFTWEDVPSVLYNPPAVGDSAAHEALLNQGERT
jgi:hypothetical protein